MGKEGHEDHGQPRSLVSPGELSARRAARHRRRAHRAVGVALSLVFAALIVIAAVALTDARSGRVRVLPLPSHTATATKPVVVRHVRPTGSASAREAREVDRVLAHTSYVQLAGRRRREVALTFDDGPGPYTREILRVLTSMHAPATFFVIGRWARLYPKLVAAEVRAGCEVGDHTETHPPLALLSPTAQAAEITEAGQAIHRAGAPNPVLFRPPYGSFDQSTLGIVRQQRMLMVLWSADTKDYTRPGVHSIIYTAVSGGQPGAIILMHDGGGDRIETVAALPRIITRLRQRGYQLVTVTRLIAADPPQSNQPPPHPLSGGI